MWLVGAGIGTLSTLLGIGGGTLTVPLLVYCNVPIHQAVGTSAACDLPIALAGAIGFAVAGWGEAGLPAGSSGYLYWPAVTAVMAGSAFLAPLGARLAHALLVATLGRLFAAVVALIRVRILVWRDPQRRTRVYAPRSAWKYRSDWPAMRSTGT